MLCVDLEMECGGIVLSLTGSALLCCLECWCVTTMGSGMCLSRSVRDGCVQMYICFVY